MTKPANWLCRKFAGIALGAMASLTMAGHAEAFSFPSMQNLLAPLVDLFNSKALSPAMVAAAAGIQDLEIPPLMVDPIVNSAQNTYLPPNFWAHVLHQESTFNPNAAPGTSDACGVAQIISPTLRLLIIEYGDKYGIDSTQLFKVTNGGPSLEYNDSVLRKLCLDPAIGASLGAEYMRDLALGMQDRFSTLKWGDVYANYVFGPTDGPRLVEAANGSNAGKPGNLFIDRRSVNGNPDLFREPGPLVPFTWRESGHRHHRGKLHVGWHRLERALTAAETMLHLSGKIGDPDRKEVLPHIPDKSSGEKICGRPTSPGSPPFNLGLTLE